MNFHLVLAFQRFQSADEHAPAHAGYFGGDVEHEMVAVAEINVGMAPAQKHRTIARRRPNEVVRRGIASRISLGLDNATAQASSRQLAHDDFADQETR
jgi:hypothetical protein